MLTAWITVYSADITGKTKALYNVNNYFGNHNYM